MNIQTYEMPKAEAREALAETRAALARKADEEYEALARAYEAMAKGYPLINLGEALAVGGSDAKGRPNFAVARADRQAHGIKVTAWGSSVRFDSNVWGRRGRDYDIRVPWKAPLELVGHSASGWAILPMIPPKVKNSVRFDASKCLILWEVEEWADRGIFAKPDVDPYLLRRLTPDSLTCAVLASWDLTPLERLVMEGRVTT